MTPRYRYANIPRHGYERKGDRSMVTDRLGPKHTTELVARFSRDQSIQPPGADPKRAPRPIALRTSTRRAVAAQREVTRAWLRELRQSARSG